MDIADPEGEASVARRRRPTMADVAAHAGVSLKSVSRVVNHEPHVSEDLAERVHASIVALGFRPDGSARQLAASAAGRLLGYVQVDASNPFFGAVARGIEEVTRPRGYLVMTGSTDADPGREGLLIETLIEARVAGIVVAAAEGGDDLLRAEIDVGTAIVCIDRQLEGAACDTVTSDNRGGTRGAVATLLARGHERIAYLGGDPRVWTARERWAGYEDAFRAAGREPDPELVVQDVGDAGRAERAAGRLLDAPSPPTAIFAAQDRIGMGALDALHRRGRQRSVALVVFDDLPLATLLEPAVAAVAQDPTELGRVAGRLLLEQLDGTGRPPRHREVATVFHDRASAHVRSDA